MKTFPFFPVFGFSTPTGVIIFRAGIFSSFSVYTRLFLNRGFPVPFAVFGGSFFFLLTPSFWGRVEYFEFEIPEPLALRFEACLFFTVEVLDGAITTVVLQWVLEEWGILFLELQDRR
jgi:hypothetical protein